MPSPVVVVLAASAALAGLAAASRAALPGAKAQAAATPRILQYAAPKDVPDGERRGVFAEYVEAVRAAHTASDWARAHELAMHATRIFPGARRTWTHLASARVRLAQWSPAIEAARRAESARDDDFVPAIAPDESHAGAAYWEGLALYATQRYPEALPRLRAARTRAPGWAEAARALAECMFVAGDAKSAAAEYAAAFDLDPDLGTARDLSYFAESRAAAGDVGGGVAAIQEALRRSPFEPGLHAKLGDLLRREGRLGDAYYALLYEIVLHGLESPFARPAVSMQDELVRIATEKHKEHDHTPSEPPATPAQSAGADAHEIIAAANGLRAIEAGATHRAARFFEHALSGTRSRSPIPYILYADALVRDGQPEKAIGVIDLALQAHPDCVPALWVRADAERARGRVIEADATRSRIRALYPAYWRFAATPGEG